MSNLIIWATTAVAAVSIACNTHSRQPIDRETLFVATPVTETNSFTPGVEGPSCDAQGNLMP